MYLNYSFASLNALSFALELGAAWHVETLSFLVSSQVFPSTDFYMILAYLLKMHRIKENGTRICRWNVCVRGKIADTTIYGKIKTLS